MIAALDPQKGISASTALNEKANQCSSIDAAASNEILAGMGKIWWMAGPSYVETIDQMLSMASLLSELGAKFLRARAYWPSAKEADFQRHLESGLKVLKAAAKHFNLSVVSEIVSKRDIALMTKYCDVIEVRSENALDFELIKELGYTKKTIILNRHPMMSTEQFLTVVGYLEKGGCCKILLAEHGARGFDPYSTELFDLSSILTLRRETAYPIFVDCSRVTRDANHTEQLAVAAIAAGADGILAELGEANTPAYNPKTLVPLQLQGIMQRAHALKCTLNALMHHKYGE